MSLFLLPLTEQDQYDLREDVTSTETLLQTEHYPERAWTKTSIQVYLVFITYRHLFEEKKNGEAIHLKKLF